MAFHLRCNTTFLYIKLVKDAILTIWDCVFALHLSSPCSGACLFIMLMGYPPYKPENAGMAKLHANMMMGRMSRIKESLSASEFPACKLTKRIRMKSLS